MDALSIYWNAVWRDALSVHGKAAPAHSAADLAAFSRRIAPAAGPSYAPVTRRWSAAGS